MAKPRQSRLRRAGLARAREAAGLTQEAFAARAGVEVSTVVRWESGCTTPLPGKRPQIARVLGVGLPELERLLSPENAAAPTPGFANGTAWEETDAGRLAAIADVRQEIAKLTAEYEVRPATGLVVPATGLLARVEAVRSSAQALLGVVDGPGVATAVGDRSAGGFIGPDTAASGDPADPNGSIEPVGSAASAGSVGSVGVVGTHRSAGLVGLPGSGGSVGPVGSIGSVGSGSGSVGSAGPGLVGSIGSVNTGGVTGSVAEPDPPSGASPLRWRRDADVAEAEAALLIGRLLWDATGRRDSSAAEEYFDRAARRAAQAGDSVLQVTACLRAAFVGLYGGDPRAGVRRCVQAAVIAAPVSQALFALARLHAAEGHALLGHAAECDRALATARGAMAAIGAGDPARGVCRPRTSQRLAGAAYLALGRHTEARVALTEAAIGYEPGKVLAIVLGHLALACLGEGDTGAALRHVRAAIELAEVTQSIGAMAVAFRAGREIVRGGGGAEPEALAIVDQLLTVVAA